VSVAAAAAFDSIDGVRLSEALRSGIYRLLAQTDHLNKINVFPVPDGDTGTNMAMTCSAVLQVLERQHVPHAGALLTKIADAAIDGARGNSGAILAQFLLGLGDRAGHLAEIKLADFASAVRGGATYARNAIMEPREGTILTVATAFAQQLETAVAQGAADFRGLFCRVLGNLRDSLAATRGQLEQLRAANVVDAGAEGFVTLVEGMSGYFDTGAIGERIDPRTIAEEEASLAVSADTRFRYCTECLVTGEAIDQRRVREELSTLGASLVVAGSTRKTRVHIHTNDPQALFDVLGKHGAVSGQKADDMLAQQQATHHARAQRVAVVSDSGGDWPDDVLEQLEMHMVPLRVHFGSKSYLDKVSLTASEFYRELTTNPHHPKTSQPPPGDFRRMYEFLTSHFEAVVSVSVSAKVSGTFNAAITAAERVAKDRVCVFDSGTASLGQGLLAVYAAECARAGYSLDEVLGALAEARARTTTLGLLARLDYAVRGGRVPQFVKPIANALRLCPILVAKPDGRIAVGDAVWGRSGLAEKFARKVRARMRPGASYRVWVGHADTLGLAEDLLAQITAGLPNIESQRVVSLGTALGAHGGPGMLVAAFQEYVPPRARPA
jgi:hypothetical protein